MKKDMIPGSNGFCSTEGKTDIRQIITQIITQIINYNCDKSFKEEIPDASTGEPDPVRPILGVKETLRKCFFFLNCHKLLIKFTILAI